MAELFNVNYFIVSQTNPHIVPLLNLKEALPTWLAQVRAAAWKGIHLLVSRGRDGRETESPAGLWLGDCLCEKGRGATAERNAAMGIVWDLKAGAVCCVAVDLL